MSRLETGRWQPSANAKDGSTAAGILAGVICVFCGEEKRATREHIYPDWVRKGIGATGHTRVTRTKGDARSEGSTTGLTWILRRSICRDCNTGWMATSLESAVKEYLLPAMLGKPIVLEPAMQRVVATWAVKTALLFQMKAMADRQPRGFAPASNLRWLYDHRDNPEPPPGSHVWLAAVDAQLGTVDSHVGWHNATTSTPPLDMELYLVSFSVGYLVFQVFGQDFREPDHHAVTGEPLRDVLLPQPVLTYMRRIWPARTEVITWPPLGRLAWHDLSRFAAVDQAITARMKIVPIPRIGDE